MVDTMMIDASHVAARPTDSSFRPCTDIPTISAYSIQHTLNGHIHAVTSCKINPSPQHHQLASVSADKTLKIWDLQQGLEIITPFSQSPSHHHSAGINDVAWSPTQPFLLATASDDKSLKIWDLRSKKPFHNTLSPSNRGHTHTVFSCAFNAAGTLLASASFDETVILWDVANGTPIKHIPAHSDPITSVDFSNDYEDTPLIASCSTDGMCRIWASDSGRCLRSLIPEGLPAVSSIKFSPNNNKYALMSCLGSINGLNGEGERGGGEFDEASIQLWDIERAKVKKMYKGHTATEYHVCSTFLINPHWIPSHGGGGGKKRGGGGGGGRGGGQFIVSGSEDHHVYIWDLHTTELVGILRGKEKQGGGDGGEGEGGHSGVVLGVDCSKDDGSLIASCGLDKSIKIWRYTG
jgi:COMPASS component SWD3